jgi:tetratricopeptide (TPR) repeat protein
MRVRVAGLAAALAYGSLIIWLYGAQPQSVAEVTGGLTGSIGAYRVDAQAKTDGLAFFRNDQFVEARAAFERADPARRDPTVQFYIAYSFYRQGWGRLYSDDALFKQGLEAVDRAIAAAPGGRVLVDDPDLGMQSADELRAELQRGITREASDFNPLRLFRPRK